MEFLTEPKPKRSKTPAGRVSCWKATSVLRDVQISFSTNTPFDEILERRRTRRKFNSVSLDETCGFVRHVFSARLVDSDESTGRMRKTFISSGALHVIDVIILSGPSVQSPILFDDRKGRFVTLPVLNIISLEQAIVEAQKILPFSEGHLILMTGNKRRLSDHYLNPESLLWRDAGAALQACSLAAFAYGYGFCPLGITGVKAITALGPPDEDYVALGMALFGR